MSRYLIKKSQLQGEIVIPPSKSHCLRAILFGTLGNGKSTVHHYLQSPDTSAMIEACRLLGAKIEVTPTAIQIFGLNGKISHAEDVIHAGNSGIVLRFCAAIGALAPHPVVVTGDYSIRHYRPIQPLLNGLNQLGASAVSMRGDGFAPVIIRGSIRGGRALIDGEDSQPVSALLIASAFAQGPLELTVKNPGEKPWVAMTLDWFKRLNIPFECHNFEEYRLSGHANYDGFDYTVPGDFSSAAFPIAAALITQSELIIRNIDMKDSQGDKELIDVFQKMGAAIDIDEEHKTVHVKKSGSLTGLTVDINNFIDAITILAVVACYAEGETHINNGAIARKKECDRIRCIATELRKMGADIEETEDGLRIRQSKLKGDSLHSYHDHRMAMSLAVAALGADGETQIDDVECVSKTFPTFVADFTRLHANLKLSV